jgi:hypothetical protein
MNTGVLFEFKSSTVAAPPSFSGAGGSGPQFVSLKKMASRLPYFLPSEVAQHNVEGDCWVSALGRVFDLTPLLAANPGT